MRNRIALTLTCVTLALAAPSTFAQNLAWIRQLGTSSTDHAYAAAPDDSHGVYVGGFTRGNLAGPNPAPGGADAWLARYGSAGNQAWICQFGTSPNDELYAVAPDRSGGAYVGGYTDGNLGGPAAGGGDAWLARYDSTGHRTWIRQLGTTGLETVNAAAPDDSGGVFVSGYTTGNLAGLNAGSEDVWLARYDATGHQSWIRQFGTSSGDGANAAAQDGLGGVYVSGFTRGSLGGLFSGGFSDAWLARYDSTGNLIWIKQFGTNGNEYAFGAVLDGSGGVYVCGYTSGSLGGPNLGGNDAWLARFDSAGNQSWIRQFGTGTQDDAYAAAPDGAGGVYVSGNTLGNFGGPSVGSTDAWLAHYDGAGSQLGKLQLGTSAQDFAPAVAQDGVGGAYVFGDTLGGLGGPSTGLWDVWLARVDGPCSTPATYCTAKINSLGCTPAIAFAGAPRAGASAGFVVSSTNVLSNHPGLLLFGTSGQAASPFQGGTLCVQAPIKRTPAMNSGGNPPPTDCSGVYSIDMNRYAQGGPIPALRVAGTVVNCQWWSRDNGLPPPDNSSLSDALEFSVCPR